MTRQVEPSAGAPSAPDGRDPPLPVSPAGGDEPRGASAVGLDDARLSGWYREDSGELFRGVPIGADDVVVDVGCGAGVNSMFCARHGARVVAIDREAQLVHEVRARLAATGTRAHTGLVSDANPLPLEDGMATRVICTEVLQHLDDSRQVLAELFRIGAEGALYLLSVPGALQEDLQDRVLPPEYRGQPGGPLRVIGGDEFAQMVGDAGLVVVEHTSYGFFWSIWWALFWACKVELYDPAHPVLDHWTAAWRALLEMPQGQQLKQQLDQFMPISQVIVARKPG
ncbi:class I SAM-dependent methyltransferase [Rhodanobacter denitrificans]|uniref:Class I SAM-dependent methyltransferase n=1 Tax=Rhodanobacter denitrificans TaxID=666685 RepID=A0A368KCS7_9GAMM|nr:class I SAM-dependent methyltransferase [Rhodanobacter denitrificans]RCS28785.1 class I SAM-dependent methyltransferase [Rhodanobacter denitrificans]